MFSRKKIFFNHAIRILLATNGLILFAGAMLGPIYALFVEKIGGSLLDASYAGAAFAAAAAITVFFMGRLSDKVKENELIIVAGYIIMGLGFFLYTAVNSIWSLLLAQVIIGFGEAIYVPAFDCVFSRHLDRKKEGTEWGAWESINYITTAIGAIIGGYTVHYFGFDLLFIIMSLFCFTSAAYIFFLPRKIL